MVLGGSMRADFHDEVAKGLEDPVTVQVSKESVYLQLDEPSPGILDSGAFGSEAQLGDKDPAPR